VLDELMGQQPGRRGEHEGSMIGTRYRGGDPGLPYHRARDAALVDPQRDAWQFLAAAKPTVWSSRWPGRVGCLQYSQQAAGHMPHSVA
jgi:hypothetical protein